MNSFETVHFLDYREEVRD